MRHHTIGDYMARLVASTASGAAGSGAVLVFTDLPTVSLLVGITLYCLTWLGCMVCDAP